VKTRRFVFTFEVSNRFLRQSPAAASYVDIAKARIAARRAVLGPRGGLYRLVTPPDKWRESQDYGNAFIRNVTVYGTKREGRYVRPDRITADLLLPDSVTFTTLTVPVEDGSAILPSGSVVNGIESPYLDFPVVVE
jgi:hypothetical protein